ncbi:DUF1365 domain-containing protein [Fodinicola feengrottensis]|uniref:DUF1365 domain-containing protein n=1 Tax=Fodinicola feengrottensis TaxID=435914 RepID=UPI0024411F72|nr:DUF1365 domain-containing protein [Fodinicola feengrottensis]
MTSVTLRTSVRTPYLYETVVKHVRAAPLRNEFSYRSYQWLVDLDELPRVPALAEFRPADHLGDPARTIRQNVESFLSGWGINLDGGRIVMLANARTFGYVFNPLSVYWCFRPDGDLECVIAEVHNTYGERHCYLLHTDERGRAEVEKVFYVSPFNPVDGDYRMSLPVPGDQLRLTVTLHRDGMPPFVASVRGHGRPASRKTLLGLAVRVPWVTATVAVQIRLQGFRLWLRRLPIVPRPTHDPQEDVQ